MTPLETVVPTSVKSAGLPISALAAAQATTIHSVPSMVQVARLTCKLTEYLPSSGGFSNPVHPTHPTHPQNAFDS